MLIFKLLFQECEIMFENRMKLEEQDFFFFVFTSGNVAVRTRKANKVVTECCFS